MICMGLVRADCNAPAPSASGTISGRWRPIRPVTRVTRVMLTAASSASYFMLSGYLPIAIFFGLILAFAIGSLGAAWAVRPTRPSASKSENYECGAQPIGEAWVQFPVGFYLVALIFLVFDTLAVFLFPWALTMRALGVDGLKAMLGFVAILSLAWVYAYREGILEWK